MGRAMVYSWLASLAFSALAFLVMPLALRRINIYEHPTLVWVSAGTLAAGTLLFTLAKPLATLPLFIWVVFPIVLAVAPVEQLTQVFAQSQLAPLFDSQLILSILGNG